MHLVPRLNDSLTNSFSSAITYGAMCWALGVQR